MTAGHNALHGSGPGQRPAFENAVAHVGCPDRRIDRLCITCCSPSQPSHHARVLGAISLGRVLINTAATAYVAEISHRPTRDVVASQALIYTVGNVPVAAWLGASRKSKLYVQNESGFRSYCSNLKTRFQSSRRRADTTVDEECERSVVRWRRYGPNSGEM